VYYSNRRGIAHPSLLLCGSKALCGMVQLLRSQATGRSAQPQLFVILPLTFIFQFLPLAGWSSVWLSQFTPFIIDDKKAKKSRDTRILTGHWLSPVIYKVISLLNSLNTSEVVKTKALWKPSLNIEVIPRCSPPKPPTRFCSHSFLFMLLNVAKTTAGLMLASEITL
jgi:hypothetical protein